MKLTPVLDSIDALAEPLRALYAQDADGKFVLQLEGAPRGFHTAQEFSTLKAEHATLKPKVDEFRENNRALFGALKLFGVEDVTKAKDVADELTTLRTTAADLKGKGVTKGSDLEAQVQAAVAAALAPVTAQLGAEKQAREKSEAAAAEANLVNVLTAAAVKAGVRPSAVRDALSRAREVYQLRDGKPTPLSGDTVLRGADGNPVAPDAWFTELGQSADAAHLFTPSTGTGADGKPGVPPGAKVLTGVIGDPLAFGRAAADIASGKAIVQ